MPSAGCPNLTTGGAVVPLGSYIHFSWPKFTCAPLNTGPIHAVPEIPARKDETLRIRLSGGAFPKGRQNKTTGWTEPDLDPPSSGLTASTLPHSTKPRVVFSPPCQAQRVASEQCRGRREGINQTPEQVFLKVGNLVAMRNGVTDRRWNLEPRRSMHRHAKPQSSGADDYTPKLKPSWSVQLRGVGNRDGSSNVSHGCRSH